MPASRGLAFSSILFLYCSNGARVGGQGSFAALYLALRARRAAAVVDYFKLCGRKDAPYGDGVLREGPEKVLLALGGDELAIGPPLLPENIVERADALGRGGLRQIVPERGRIGVGPRRPPHLLHAGAVIVDADRVFPALPLPGFQRARFLLIPGRLDQLEITEQEEVRDDALVAAGRLPVLHRLGERRAHRRVLHRGHIDGGDGGRQRLHGKHAARACVLADGNDQHHERQHDREGAHDLGDCDEGLQAHCCTVD